jgi:hypothetical protein
MRSPKGRRRLSEPLPTFTLAPSEAGGHGPMGLRSSKNTADVWGSIHVRRRPGVVPGFPEQPGPKARVPLNYGNAPIPGRPSAYIS